MSLKVVIPTSFVPWHPDPSTLFRAVESIRALTSAPIYIYCDYPPPWTSEEEHERYEQYLVRIWRCGKLVRATDWVGLAGLYRKFIQDFPNSNILNVEHDFVLSPRIDLDRAVGLLSEGARVIRFHKRTLPETSRHVVDTYCEQVPSKPLIRTNGWASEPHLASPIHYQRVKQILDRDPSPRYKTIERVWARYKADINKLGFSSAQRDWGCYVYGKFGDMPYSTHLDGTSGHWHRKREKRYYWRSGK